MSLWSLGLGQVWESQRREATHPLVGLREAPIVWRASHVPTPLDVQLSDQAGGEEAATPAPPQGEPTWTVVPPQDPGVP